MIPVLPRTPAFAAALGDDAPLAAFGLLWPRAAHTPGPGDDDEDDDDDLGRGGDGGNIDPDDDEGIDEDDDEDDDEDPLWALT